MLQSQNLNQNQSVLVTTSPVDSNGQPANPANGVPTWHPDDPSITVTPATDGLSATVKSGTKPGAFQVDVTGQSIPFGPNFTSSFNVTVAKANASGFNFSFGVPF